MKLDQWLDRESLTASEFAPQVEASVSTITRLIRREVWISRELAERIFRRTAGQVTPNDFLGIAPDDAGTDQPDAPASKAAA